MSFCGLLTDVDVFAVFAVFEFAVFEFDDESMFGWFAKENDLDLVSVSAGSEPNNASIWATNSRAKRPSVEGEEGAASLAMDGSIQTDKHSLVLR